MPYCAVATCRNYYRANTVNSVHYFRFPREEPTRSVWIKRCGQKYEFNVDQSRLCSAHFEEECYDPAVKLRRTLMGHDHYGVPRMLMKGAVPTLLLPDFDPEEDDKSEIIIINSEGNDQEMEQTNESERNDVSMYLPEVILLKEEEQDSGNNQSESDGLLEEIESLREKNQKLGKRLQELESQSAKDATQLCLMKNENFNLKMEIDRLKSLNQKLMRGQKKC